MKANNPFLEAKTYTITITADRLIATTNFTGDINNPEIAIFSQSQAFSPSSTFVEICKHVLTNKTPFQVNITLG